MKNAIAALKAFSSARGATADRPDLPVAFEELNELVGIKALERLEQRYLTADQLRRKYQPVAEPAR